MVVTGSVRFCYILLYAFVQSYSCFIIEHVGFYSTCYIINLIDILQERDAKDIEIPNIKWDVFELMMRLKSTHTTDAGLKKNILGFFDRGS